MNGEAPRDPAPASAGTAGWAVFDTELGTCGIAWGDAGITGVALPDAEVAGTGEYLARRYPGVPEAAPPADIESAIARITAVLAGTSADSLVDLELDLTGVTGFAREVYRIARAVPPGNTTTYGAIAADLGGPGVARAVGRALGDNPFPIIVPCHRVTAADGAIGGFSASGGARTKRRMLLIEHAGEQESPGLFGATELYGS